MSHEHWQVSDGKHVARDAAKDQGSNRISREGTHHQHVGSKLVCCAQEGFAEGALAGDRQHVQPGCNAMLLEYTRQAWRRRGVPLSSQHMDLFGLRRTAQAGKHRL
jgi:hypothetical protein